MCKSKIKLEGVMQLSEVVSNLEKLVSDMKSGTVILTAGEDRLALQPSVLVNVAMKASQEKDKEKFSLELRWRKQKDIEGFAEKCVAPAAEA